MSAVDVSERLADVYAAMGQSIPAAKNRPDFVAHYTSMEALEGILKSSQIWLSNPAFMNDYSELIGGLAAAKQGLSRAVGTPIRDETLQKLFSRYQLTELDFFTRYASGTYVASFSEHKGSDDHGTLSMWRAYGANGAGVALVFDVKKFRKTDEFRPVLIFDSVTYKTQEERVSRFFDAFRLMISKMPKSVTNSELDEVASWMVGLAFREGLFTKDVGFSEEKEWRLVYCPPFTKVKLSGLIDYHVASGMIQPKLKLDLCSVDDLVEGGSRLDNLIARLIVGPTQAHEMRLEAVRIMLRKLGFGEVAGRVSYSAIPYRPS